MVVGVEDPHGDPGQPQCDQLWEHDAGERHGECDLIGVLVAGHHQLYHLRGEDDAKNRHESENDRDHHRYRVSGLPGFASLPFLE